MVKNLPAIQETWVPSLGWEDPLEKGMATHSSILAWRIPWTEEPGGLQSMGSQRVRHDWVTSTTNFTFQQYQNLCSLTPWCIYFCSRCWEPPPGQLPTTYGSVFQTALTSWHLHLDMYFPNPCRKKNEHGKSHTTFLKSSTHISLLRQVPWLWQTPCSLWRIISQVQEGTKTGNTMIRILKTHFRRINLCCFIKRRLFRTYILRCLTLTLYNSHVIKDDMPF